MNKKNYSKASFVLDRDVWEEGYTKTMKPEAKLFLIELKSFLSTCFPYGFCACLNESKLLKDENIGLMMGLRRQDLDLMSSDEIIEYLQSEVSLHQQLTIAKSLESGLHILIPGFTQEQVAQHLQTLMDGAIIFRDEEGFIYDIDLVKHFKARLQEKRGKGRSNRSGKRARPKSNAGQREVKIDFESNHDFYYALDGALTDWEASQSSSPTAMHAKESTSDVDVAAPLSNTEDGIPSFDLKDIYVGGYEAAKSRWKWLPEQGYVSWHRFVSYLIARPGYYDIFQAQMVTPPDFARVVAENGFTPEKWDAVIERMLGTGIKPCHKLYFRLCDFIGYVNTAEKRSRW